MWLISNRLRRSHSFNAFFSNSAVALLLSVFTNWTFWGDGSSIWAWRLPRLKFPSSSWADPALPFALFKSRSSLSILILSWSISRFFVARSFDSLVFKSRNSRSSWFCFFFWASSFQGSTTRIDCDGNDISKVIFEAKNFDPFRQHRTKDLFVLVSFHFQMLFSLASISLRGEIILLLFSSVLLFDSQVQSFHESEISKNTVGPKSSSPVSFRPAIRQKTGTIFWHIAYCSTWSQENNENTIDWRNSL